MKLSYLFLNLLLLPLKPMETAAKHFKSLLQLGNGLLFLPKPGIRRSVKIFRYPNGANLSIHWCVNSLCSAIMSNNRQRHKLFLLPPPQATFLPRAHTPHTHTYAHSTLCSEIWSAQPRSWFASVFTGQGCTDKTKEGGFRPVGGNYHPA